jgi:hypothetical protein
MSIVALLLRSNATIGIAALIIPMQSGVYAGDRAVLLIAGVLVC